MPSPRLLAALASLLSAPLACTPVTRSICEQTCECQPCTEADVQACVDQGAKVEEAAAQAGCSAELDAYLQCVDENLSCRKGGTPGTDACDDPLKGLTTCTGTGNPFANVCEQAIDKQKECFNQTLPPFQGECTGVIACQSACTVAASCDELAGNAPQDAFFQCLNKCNGK